MRTNIALVLVALALLAGCSSLPYSDSSSRTDCERSGGYWQAAPAVCERPRS
jgi:hypothetical protein